MKKKILLLMGVFSLGLLQAQVGVNTNFPRSLFHIDGMGDNPQDLTTALTAAQVANDVIINTHGQVGVGVANPVARLDVFTANRATTPAMRINDGTPVAGDILVSDALGNASWAPSPSTQGKRVVLNSWGRINVPINPATPLLLHSERVETSGSFLITIRWRGVYSATGGPLVNGQTYARFFLVRGVSDGNQWAAENPARIIDRSSYYVHPTGNNVINFSTAYAGTFREGEFLKLYVRVMAGGTWILGVDGVDQQFNPSLVIYRI